jgi:hypothetical protein
MLCSVIGLNMDREQSICEFFLDGSFEPIADVVSGTYTHATRHHQMEINEHQSARMIFFLSCLNHQTAGSAKLFRRPHADTGPFQPAVRALSLGETAQVNEQPKGKSAVPDRSRINRECCGAGLLDIPGRSRTAEPFPCRENASPQYHFA